MSRISILIAFLFAVSCSQKGPGTFVLVKGGIFKNPKSGYYEKGITIPAFYIGIHEVTQKEWTDVMGNNPSHFKGDNLPVETVSWYECIEYCNKRSMREGFLPYYNINSHQKDPGNANELDNLKWIVTINENANGYRLPTEAEWEYAAGGGQASSNYTYSGSNNVDEVAWYWKNSGDKYLTGVWSWTALQQNNNKTKPAATKRPNELGIYDMSGNVREWCWDWQESNETGMPQGRAWRGGGWMGADFCCESSFRASLEASGKGPDQGFRLCRSGKAAD